MELSWVLERHYGFSRDQIASVFEELITSAELYFESTKDVVRAVDGHRRG